MSGLEVNGVNAANAQSTTKLQTTGATSQDIEVFSPDIETDMTGLTVETTSEGEDPNMVQTGYSGLKIQEDLLKSMSEKNGIVTILLTDGTRIEFKKDAKLLADIYDGTEATITKSWERLTFCNLSNAKITGNTNNTRGKNYRIISCSHLNIDTQSSGNDVIGVHRGSEFLNIKTGLGADKVELANALAVNVDTGIEEGDQVSIDGARGSYSRQKPEGPEEYKASIRTSSIVGPGFLSNYRLNPEAIISSNITLDNVEK
jgi:hypothetical protein